MLRKRLIGLIAAVPTSLHAKLHAAFLAIAGLLVVLGAIGFTLLGQAHARAEEPVKLQQKIAAYRQLQNDATTHLYGVTSALLVPDEPTLQTTLRQLSQFGYDFDHLRYVASDEVDLLSQVQDTYGQFRQVVTRAVTRESAPSSVELDLEARTRL